VIGLLVPFCGEPMLYFLCYKYKIISLCCDHHKLDWWDIVA